jgi:hypothetical protein
MLAENSQNRRLAVLYLSRSIPKLNTNTNAKGKSIRPMPVHPVMRVAKNLDTSQAVAPVTTKAAVIRL